MQWTLADANRNHIYILKQIVGKPQANRHQDTRLLIYHCCFLKLIFSQMFDFQIIVQIIVQFLSFPKPPKLYNKCKPSWPNIKQNVTSCCVKTHSIKNVGKVEGGKPWKKHQFYDKSIKLHNNWYNKLWQMPDPFGYSTPTSREEINLGLCLFVRK